ncbi:guanine nucleotide-binding protein subunit alpha, partial [Rhizophlyctis rosea]
MTTAVTESIVSINRITYRIYDVAGHRGMRHAWANYFEDARAVIFVVAISSYDQCLAEDPTVNRMKDAMQLFAAVCNHPLFAETSVILLLNKIDIFRRKIKVKAIDEVFKDYKGGSDYTQATSYFARIFVKLNKHPDKQIYTHLTWATDTKQTKVVLAAVTDTVQRIALRMAG